MNKTNLLKKIKLDKTNFVFLSFLLLLTLVMLFFSFKSKFPGRDFFTNVALYLIGKELLKNFDIFFWSPHWFAGFPMTFLIGRAFIYNLIAFPFTFVLHPLEIFRVLIVFSHLLAGIGFYLFVKLLTNDFKASLTGAFVYALHPVHIYTSASFGYFEISLFYSLFPFLFFFIGKIILDNKKNCTSKLLSNTLEYKNVFISSILLSILFLSSTEMFFVTIPFLLFFILFTVFFYRQFNKLIPIFLIFVFFTCLTAFFWIPAVVETKWISLFPKDHIEWGIKNFVVPGIIQLLSQENNFYIGISLVVMILFSLFLNVFKRQNKIIIKNLDVNDFYFLFFLTIFVILNISISFGAFSIFERFQQIQALSSLSPFSYNLILIIIGLLIFLFFLILYISYGSKFIVFILFLLIIPFLKPFLILRYVVPLYRNIREPAFFYILTPIFGVSVLVSLFFCKLKEFCGGYFKFLLFLFSLLMFFDFFPHKNLLYLGQTLDKAFVERLNKIYSEIKKNEKNTSIISSITPGFSLLPFSPKNNESEEIELSQYRVISYEGYNPYLDFGATFNNFSVLRSCYNWTAPKWSGILINEMYLNLKNENWKIASDIAGIFNVKYAVDLVPLKPTLDKYMSSHNQDFLKYFEFPENRIFKSASVSKELEVIKVKKFKPYISFHSGKVFHLGDYNDLNLIPFFVNAGYSIIEIDSISSLVSLLKRIKINSKTDFFISTSDIINNKLIKHLLADKFLYQNIYSEKNLKDLVVYPLSSNPLKIANFKRVNSKEIKFDVYAFEDGILSISESYYPHWRVIIDGDRRKPLRVNQAFLGIEVERGIHSIKFYYSTPFYFKLGLLISFIAVFLMFAMMLKICLN